VDSQLSGRSPSDKVRAASGRRRQRTAIVITRARLSHTRARVITPTVRQAGCLPYRSDRHLAKLIEITEPTSPVGHRSVSSVRTVHASRSAYALARGHRGGIFTTAMPASARTASNAAVYCPARSRTSVLNAVVRSPRFMCRLGAAWLVQAPSGLAVTPRSGGRDQIHVELRGVRGLEHGEPFQLG